MFTNEQLATEAAHMLSLHCEMLLAAIQGDPERETAIRAELHDREALYAQMKAVNADIAAGVYTVYAPTEPLRIDASQIMLAILDYLNAPKHHTAKEVSE